MYESVTVVGFGLDTSPGMLFIVPAPLPLLNGQYAKLTVADYDLPDADFRRYFGIDSDSVGIVERVVLYDRKDGDVIHTYPADMPFVRMLELICEDIEE